MSGKKRKKKKLLINIVEWMNGWIFKVLKNKSVSAGILGNKSFIEFN